MYPLFLIIFLIFISSISGCSSLRDNPTQNENGFLTKSFLSDPWYEDFLSKNHRKPVLEMIDIRDNSSKRFMYAPLQNQFIKATSEKMVEILLRSRKVKFVSTRIRKYNHLERYFEMRHARSATVKEPGHLTGADLVLVYRHSAIPPEKINGSSRHFVALINFDFELVDIQTDEIVWKGSAVETIDTTKGISAVEDVSNPGSQTKFLKLEGKKWVDAR